MLTDTEGIVLRQVKTSYGRRMILLFSKKYGKISAGTGLNERGKERVPWLSDHSPMADTNSSRTGIATISTEPKY